MSPPSPASSRRPLEGKEQELCCQTHLGLTWAPAPAGKTWGGGPITLSPPIPLRNRGGCRHQVQ